VRFRSRLRCRMVVRCGRTLAAVRAGSIVLTRHTPLDPVVVTAGRPRYASCRADSESVPRAGPRQAPSASFGSSIDVGYEMPPSERSQRSHRFVTRIPTCS
jgi:hypothetical protein